MRVWFLTDGQQDFTREASKVIDIEPQSGRQAYYANLSDLPTARGRLTGLRFEAKNIAPAGEGEAMLDEACRWLDCYFEGKIPNWMPPLQLEGTPFQQRVWQELMHIPYGRTVSYGQLAERIGCRSAQAVGGAVGRNPVAIIVPCHRVVGADGSLTGFAYGLERKRWLLTHEAQTTIAT